MKRFTVLLALTLTAACSATPTPAPEPATPDTAADTQATQPTVVPQPPADTPIPPTPTPILPTSTPGRPVVEILSSSDYVDSLGYTHIVGEVQNVSDQPIEFVKINVTLYDDAGQLLYQNETHPTAIIPPGGKSPFFITGSKYWDQAARYEVQALWDATDQMPRQDLTINSHRSFTDDSGHYHIVGEVENTGGTPAESVLVVVTLYNPEGRVVGTFSKFSDLDIIQPGGKSPFDATTSHNPDDADHYEIQVQAD